MAEPLLQIYSATYSNVPVFEFVTSEGPIMRRKLDSWINATHILKIAKFPKAKRTRILEKDVQVGIHDKVQGGYGKYQGTYVPLHLGKEIAQRFGIYDILRPIFDFVYVEGTSETPPPAPKHNHASASNIARRQVQQQHLKHKRDLHSETPESTGSFKRVKTEAEGGNGRTADAENSISGTSHKTSKVRPKRVALPPRAQPPSLAESQTVPIPPPAAGPNLGVFSSMRQDSSLLSFPGNKSLHLQLPPLVRQDTERDALLIMASNMNVRRADLEADHSDNEQSKPARTDPFSSRGSEDDEFMSGKELFGSRAFIASQSGTRGPYGRSFSGSGQNGAPESAQKLLSLNGSISGENPGQGVAEDAEFAEYFNTLLNYLMEDGSLAGSPSKSCSFELPEKILNPPQPLQKININRPVDEDGNTIFHWACSMANLGMMEFLLSIFSNFINSEVKNFNGETPLMFLVQFRNCYQLNNFPVILDMLFDSVLSVDKLGRTVLHHIALACDISKFDTVLSEDAGFKTRKERFTNYYFEVVFSKIVGFPDYQLLQGDERRSLEDKKEVISKFINHQDNNGNTAFHIVAYNMSKKCIKTFICYHNFIDLTLQNHVNFTAEDYLASHNYVLRLENEDGTNAQSGENGLVPSQALFPIEHTQSFDSQLHKTRALINARNTCINKVTEELGELSYSMEMELKEKDEKLHQLYKCLRIVGLEKFKSQKTILQLFNLHHLVADIAKDYGVPEDGSEEGSSSVLALDSARDGVIQEEISRLLNDLAFQVITSEEQLAKSMARYKFAREKLIAKQLNILLKVPSSLKDSKAEDTTQLDLAVTLQKQVMRRKMLAKEVYEYDSKVPLLAAQREEYKENVNTGNGESALTTNTLDEESATETDSKNSSPTIADFPPSDKLYKYCKLVALSCGMSMTEVKNSIDLLEQSLAKAANGN